MSRLDARLRLQARGLIPPPAFPRSVAAPQLLGPPPPAISGSHPDNLFSVTTFGGTGANVAPQAANQILVTPTGAGQANLADALGGLTYWINPLAFGADRFGKQDSTAAFLQAFGLAVQQQLNATIYIPHGRYLLYSTMLFTLPPNLALTIFGDGRDATELMWMSDVDGIHFSLSANAGNFDRQIGTTFTGTSIVIRDLALIRGVPTLTPGRNAFHVDNPTFSLGTGIRQIQASHMKIRGILVPGTTAGGGWANGLWYDCCAQTDTNDVTVHGSNVGCNALQINGDAAHNCFSVDHRISNLNTHGATNLAIGDYVQGITWNGGAGVGGGT